VAPAGNLGAMTTTDTGPIPPQPTPSAQRVLRRSRTDRVGAGVAGGQVSIGQQYAIVESIGDLQVLFQLSDPGAIGCQDPRNALL